MSNFKILGQKKNESNLKKTKCVNELQNQQISPKQQKHEQKIMKVYAKIRALTEECNDQDKVLALMADTQQIKIINEDYIRKRGEKSFEFNKVFSKQSSQQEIFEEVVQPLIDNIFSQEKSGLLFTYGVTNSGKTFTLQGNENQLGILQYAFDQIFKQKQNLLNVISIKKQQSSQNYEQKFDKILTFQQQEKQFILDDVYVTFSGFEIYNELVTDLLHEDLIKTTFQHQQQQQNNKKFNFDIKPIDKYKLCNNYFNNIYNFIVQKFDIQVYNLDTIDDCINLFQVAVQNRIFAETNLNIQSSRAHCCFQFNVQFIYKYLDQFQFKNQQICFVDLAGSERNKKTGNEGKELQESIKINQSLFFLQRIIQQLNERIKPTFRESILTQILEPFFCDDNNLIMITCIHPGLPYLSETEQVLNYSCMAKNITYPVFLERNYFKNQMQQQSLFQNSIQQNFINIQQHENYNEINQLRLESMRKDKVILELKESLRIEQEKRQNEWIKLGHTLETQIFSEKLNINTNNSIDKMNQLQQQYEQQEHLKKRLQIFYSDKLELQKKLTQIQIQEIQNQFQYQMNELQQQSMQQQQLTNSQNQQIKILQDQLTHLTKFNQNQEIIITNQELYCKDKNENRNKENILINSTNNNSTPQKSQSKMQQQQQKFQEEDQKSPNNKKLQPNLKKQQNNNQENSNSKSQNSQKNFEINYLFIDSKNQNRHEKCKQQK